ncbi:hypothetical protein L6164_018255 [Bauhinia variegata]|nr:hypothetical protein L6164_018255 [Bauhinia variegata]
MWTLRLGGSNAMDNLPTFKNLVHLRVEGTVGFEALWHLLRKTPVVETLVCDKVYSSTLVLPPEVPSCFESHLKRVTLSTIEAIDWHDVVRGLAKYVLKNAKVLEQMTINLARYCATKDVHGKQIEEELLKSPRGCPHVEVQALVLGGSINLMPNLPTFKNLVHLRVQPIVSYGTLRGSAPCFESHLKRVTLSTIKWQDEVRVLAKFVLRNAKASEQMTLSLMKGYTAEAPIKEEVKKGIIEIARRLSSGKSQGFQLA